MQENNNDSSSLEQSENQDAGPAQELPKKKKGLSFQRIISHVNIYLLLFILIVILAGIIVYVSLQRTNQEVAQTTIPTEELTPEELEELRGSDAKVGDPKQQLTIESTTTFSGKVFVKDSIDVAGTIKVGGALNLPGITVSGDSSFDQITANELSIAGDTSIQGQLNIQQGLAVSGAGTFGGPLSAPQITIGSLQIDNDLTFGRHLDAGGSTPGKTDGTATGGGGTTSVSGTDTAGTLTVNTGGGTVAGCFATIRFTQAFNGTPHIAITPVGSAAAGLNYYINRTSSNFSICTTNPAPTGASFSFDWVAID